MKGYSIITEYFSQNFQAVKFFICTKKYTSSILSNALPIISICIALCFTISGPLRAQDNQNSGSKLDQIPYPDSIRYTVIIDGHRKAERRMWQEGSNTWHFEYEGDLYDSYHFPRTERLVLDNKGFLMVLEISGQRNVWDQWIERYEKSNNRAQWTAYAQSGLGPNWFRTLDDGEAEISGPAYYTAVHPVHDPGVLARFLPDQPDQNLPP